MAAIQVRVETFERLSSEWERLLLAAAGQPTVFATPTWQREWWRNFGAPGDLLLCSLREAGELVGVAPLMRRGSELAFLGESDLVDYHHFPRLHGLEERFFPALLDFLDDIPDWESLHLTSLPRSMDTALSALYQDCEGRGWAFELEPEDCAPVVTLPRSWSDYLAGLAKKHRHELNRKIRRLSEAGDVRTLVTTDPQELEERFGDFVRMFKASRQDKSLFLTGPREHFFRTVSHALARRGQAQLQILELDGRAVAMSLLFVMGRYRYVYNAARDPAYNALSVGFVNHAMTIKHAIEAGATALDFMRGDERYKYELGARDQMLVTVRAFRCSQPRQPALAVSGVDSNVTASSW